MPILGKSTWADGFEALADALQMEKIVTGSIKKLIDVCDNDAIQVIIDSPAHMKVIHISQLGMTNCRIRTITRLTG